MGEQLANSWQTMGKQLKEKSRFSGDYWQTVGKQSANHWQTIERKPRFGIASVDLILKPPSSRRPESQIAVFAICANRLAVSPRGGAALSCAVTEGVLTLGFVL